MTVLEQSPQLARSSQHGELHVERTDISFYDLPGDKVRIQVRVHNTGARRSLPTPIRLESAPLGAFVSWEPLARLIVPTLEPGESRLLTTDVPRMHATPLGDFNNVPPKRLLSAISAPDQPSRQSGGGIGAMLNLLLRAPTTPPSRTDQIGSGSLAVDLWDLVGRGQPHWAGNINVFIGARKVERHRAMALRVYPGRTNLAMFVVGGPRNSDAYAFELSGLKAEWEAALYDGTHHRSLVVRSSDARLDEREWVVSNGGLMVMLATQPPADCEIGNLEVHVTRRSCGTTAIVEFNLDPRAQGPGCYTI